MLTETLLGAVADAVLGYALDQSGLAERLRARLGREPARLAFQTALAHTYTAFARKYPQWTAALFDESFLAKEAAPELALFLTRTGQPDPALLAQRWAAHLDIKDSAWVQELTPATADFLCWLEAELKTQPALQPIFDSRALEELPSMAEDLAAVRQVLEKALQQAARYHEIVENSQQQVAKYYVVVKNSPGAIIGDNAHVTQNFFGSDYTTLDEYYISPDAVYERVRLDDFVGREWLSAQWDAFLNDPGHDRGVWLLVGEAGVGKTTFLAHLARKRGYLHLFSEQAPGEANWTRGMQSLAVQLITRYRLEPYNKRDALPQTLIGFGDFLDRMLRQAAKQLIAGEKLVLVVDALDEAGGPTGGNAFGLPKNLPAGVYLLLSQRPTAAPIVCDSALKRVDLLAGSNENRADVEEYLYNVAGRPAIQGQLAAQGLSADSFVQTLSERSAGNWMYLHYVIGEIEQGWRAPLELGKLPVGLAGYYAEYWGRWLVRPDWDSLYGPVLATLGAAFEPLPMSLLLAWAGLPGERHHAVQRLLRLDWRAFFYEIKGDEELLYRPYHASLGDFLRGEAPAQAMPPTQEVLLVELAERSRDAHRRIADYFLATPTRWNEYNGYAFRYLSAHLIQAGMGEKLAELIERPAWYKAQRNHDPALRDYALDVERALGMAEKQGLEGVLRVISWSLLYGSVRSRATRVPVAALETMVLLGEPERALCYAELIVGPREQGDAYVQIACQLQEKQASTALVSENLKRALAAAEQIENASEQASCLADIAWALAQAGEAERARQTLDRALATAEQIEEVDERASSLADIAWALAQVFPVPGLEVASWLCAAFRVARTHGQDEVLEYIAAFAPILVKPELDLLAQIWDYIQSTERLFRGDSLPAEGGMNRPNEEAPLDPSLLP